jgi:hypothetical protein
LEIEISVGLVLSSFDTIRVSIYNEDFTFFDTNRVWTFDGILFSIMFGLYIMQKPSYLGKNVLVFIWLRMVLTQIITRVYRSRKAGSALSCRIIN